MRANTIVWLALVGLTLGGFLLGAAASRAHAGFLILTLAGGKGLLLGWRFMEVRVAHPAWKAAFAGAVVVLVAGLALLSRVSR